MFDAAAPLEHFFDRAIGATTLAAVDASGYAHGYVRLMIWLTLGFLITFALCRWLAGWVERFAPANLPEHRWLARVAEIWAASALLVVWFPQITRLDWIPRILAGLFLSILGVLVIRRHGHLRPILARSPRPAPTRWLVAGLPLLVIPASLPAAQEIQAAFRSLELRTVTLALSAILLASSITLFAWRPLSGRDEDGRRNFIPQLCHLYALITVSVVALVRCWPARRVLGDLDYFHLAERVLPTQQLFQFSKWPIVDLRLSHTFSDMLFPWLYARIHGLGAGEPTTRLDLLTWDAALEVMVCVVLAYVFLARMLSPGYAMLACLFLPILAGVPRYYALALLPALALDGALRRPTTGRFATLGFSLVATLLWRIDFGLAAGAAAAAVLALQLLRGRHRRLAAAKGFAWVAATCLTALGALRLAVGPSFTSTLAFFFESYSYRLITRTRPEVIDSFSVAAVVQYYLVPGLALIYIATLATRSLILRCYVDRRVQVMAFLASFSLVMSARSMERHSLVEGFNLYLSVLLLALLPCLFRRLDQRPERPASRVVFAAALVAVSLLALPPISRSEFSPRDILARPVGLDRYDSLAEGEPRVLFDRRPHAELVAFVERYLETDETFLDVSNAPLLYALTDREFPTYVIPSLLQTAETVQERALDDLGATFEADRLPMVIFKQGNSFWDATDGVPNEVRSYRVAEWIYERYRPAVAVGRFQVWWQADRDVPWRETNDFDTWTLERAAQPTLRGAVMTELDGQIRLRGESDDAQAYGLFDLSTLPELSPLDVSVLRLQIESDSPEAIQVFAGFDGEYFSEEFHAWIHPQEIEGGVATLRLRHPLDATRLTDLRFDPPQGATLTMGNVVLGRQEVQRPLTDPELAQHFDLGRLPAVWAHLDPLQATDRTQVVADLLARPVSLEPGETVMLDLADSSQAEPPSGGSGQPPATYLHLELRPTGPRSITAGRDVLLTYGGDPVSTIEFDVGRSRAGDSRTEASDHLIRLSTQWRWWRGDVDQIELVARRSLMVERALLRDGD